MTYSSARMRSTRQSSARHFLQHWSPVHLAKRRTLLGSKHRKSLTADPQQQKICPEELVEAV